jgi:exopolysaccharide biosynthesis polyprenyl glycosylphosphotransferase
MYQPAAHAIASPLLHALSTAVGTKRLFHERILMLGRTPLAERIVLETEARAGACGSVIGIVDDLPSPVAGATAPPLLGPTGRLLEIVDDVRPHRIVVALTERRGGTPIQALLESCLVRGIVIEEAAQCYERLTGQLAIESLTPTSIMFSGKFPPSAVHQALSRAVSLLVAIVGLVCSLPLMGLIAIAIKLESRGPVLFVQPRVGANGRPFKLLKFRTMRVTMVPHSEWAADNHARVTRVGKWLRTLRLDELPQFINILLGEMNLVGPRPHPVCNLELFTLVTRNLNETTGTSVSYYHLRSMVRPGLTGWAQIRYRYANNLEEEIEKLRYDLYYVKHFSVWLDLRILADTCRVLFSGGLCDGVEAAARRVKAAGRSVKTVRARPFRAARKLTPTRAA